MDEAEPAAVPVAVDESQAVCEPCEEDVGGAAVKPLRAPHEPTAEEIEEHNASGHAHYRAWCPHCVAGKGKADSHRQLEAERDHARTPTPD